MTAKDGRDTPMLANPHGKRFVHLLLWKLKATSENLLAKIRSGFQPPYLTRLMVVSSMSLPVVMDLELAL